MLWAHGFSCRSNGNEPLLPTDVRDLAAVLDVPQEWLCHGWQTPPAV